MTSIYSIISIETRLVTRFSGFKIYQDVKKLLRGHRAILSYLGLKFPQIQSRKGDFLLYRTVK